MSEDINYDRRRFLTAAITTIAAAELGMIGSSAAQSSKTKATTLPAINRERTHHSVLSSRSTPGC